MRARTGAFAPIAGAVGALARRNRAPRGGVPRPDSDRVRIGVLPRVLAAAVGLVAIAAVSTALAPSSSSEAVPQPNVGVAAQKAPKSPVARRVARRTALARPMRGAKPAAVRTPAVAPRKDRISATTTTAPAVAQRVVRGSRVAKVRGPRSAAPVTTPPPPSPQPVSPAPQPPPAAGDANDKPPDDDNSGPGGGDEDEGNGGGKGKGDKDKDKDKGEDEDEGEDNEGPPQPPPPPPPDDDEDDD